MQDRLKMAALPAIVTAVQAAASLVLLDAVTKARRTRVEPRLQEAREVYLVLTHMWKMESAILVVADLIMMQVAVAVDGLEVVVAVKIMAAPAVLDMLVLAPPVPEPKPVLLLAELNSSRATISLLLRVAMVSVSVAKARFYFASTEKEEKASRASQQAASLHKIASIHWYFYPIQKRIPLTDITNTLLRLLCGTYVGRCLD